MEIGRADGNTIENTRQKTQEQTVRQVTKAAEQEGESRDARTKAVSAPPPAGQAQGNAHQGNAGQVAAGQDAQTVTTATASSEEDDNYQTIVNKANSGQTLTASELNVLRSRNPALYAKVAQAGDARQALRQQMEADPSHAGQAMNKALSSLSREELLNAHQPLDEEGQALVKNALQEEYNNFAAKYDQVLFDPLSYPE